MTAAAANELIRRRVARQSIDDYANYMAGSQHLDFEAPPAKHHRAITRALDELLLPLDHPRHPVDQHGVPVTRLLITAPPGSAKSTYISVQFATYYLMLNPTHHILCSSNVTDLAESFNRRRRTVCMSQEWKNLSGTELDPKAMGVERFYTLAQGSIMATGVGSAIVGIRSNLNILDDPIKSWEQAQSEGQLLKIWDWYEGEYRNRLVPTGLEVVMHQRWARNDIAGVLLRLIASGEETGWKVINFPMVAENERTDPIGRKQGEVLWSEWFTSKQLTEWQRDPIKWAALYQQKPIDEDGAWVGKEHIMYLSPSEWAERRRQENMKYIGSLDLALSVGKGDWTVLGIIAITPERDLVICHITRKQQAPEETVEQLYELNGQYHPVGWLMDDDNATKVFHRLLLEHARSKGLSPPPVELMPMRGRDKEVRAAAIRGYFRSNRIWIVQDPVWSPPLVEEILVFPAIGEPDDQVDMLGLVGRKAIMLSGGEVPKKSVQIPKNRVIEVDGVPHLSCGLTELFEHREKGLRRHNRLRLG